MMGQNEHVIFVHTFFCVFLGRSVKKLDLELLSVFGCWRSIGEGPTESHLKSNERGTCSDQLDQIIN